MEVASDEFQLLDQTKGLWRQDLQDVWAQQLPYWLLCDPGQVT